MYAIVANVMVENPDEARLLLPEAREALVSRAPGIVSGYRLEPIDGIGTSVLVFETKEYADQAAQYPVPPMPGVTLLDLTIREVLHTSETPAVVTQEPSICTTGSRPSTGGRRHHGRTRHQRPVGHDLEVDALRRRSLRSDVPPSRDQRWASSP